MSFLSTLGSSIGGQTLGAAVVVVSADTTGLTTGLAKAKGEVTASTNQMGSAAKSLAPAFFVAGAAAVAFGVSAVKSFVEAEQVMAQTEAVIKSTGGTAGYTATQIAAMAKSFEQSTTFSDEAVQSMENVLLTFRAIGHEALPQTTQAVLDMSTALGTDLQGAAIQVGKALQDPTIGLTALRRVGVSFSQSQIALIENFQETGQAAKAQQIILDELNTEFGGSAAAALDTYGGKWEQLMNKIDDAKESLGGWILAQTDSAAGTKAGAVAVDGLNASLAAAGQAYLDNPIVNEGGAAFLKFALAEETAAIKANAAKEEISNFADFTADELDSWQGSATQSMGFVEASFEDLADEAHLSAREILRAFDDALRQQADFAKNSDRFLSQVAKNLGPGLREAAGQMVAALAAAGPAGAARMEALAGASAKMRKAILRDWQQSGQGAQNYVSDLSQVDAKLNALDGRQVNIDIITHYIQTGKLD